MERVPAQCCYIPYLHILHVIVMTLNYDSSRSSRVKVHSANRKSVGGFVSDLHCVQHFISQRVFEIFDAEIMRPISRTVQGYPRSKVMVPIDSP